MTRARGQTTTATASIQSTSDFRLRTGDYIFRGDGTRWKMRIDRHQPSPHRVRDARPPADPGGYNFGQVNLEDPDHVSYLIPPMTPPLQTTLDSRVQVPQDFSSIETIRGPLT